MKKIAVIDRDVCVACGVCMKACPKGAISSTGAAMLWWMRINVSAVACVPKPAPLGALKPERGVQPNEKEALV